MRVYKFINLRTKFMATRRDILRTLTELGDDNIINLM